MNLQNVYDQLAYGELRSFFMGGTDIDLGAQGIQRDFYAQYLPFIIAGLTNLHTKFALREGLFYVDLTVGQMEYSLTWPYAKSNPSTAIATKYINDDLQPYKSNLMKVARVYGTLNKEEFEIPLNDLDDPSSIRTSTFNTLQLPTDSTKALWLQETTQLKVFYQADHPEINISRASAAPVIVEILLPPTLLSPLVLYVASRKLNPTGQTPGALHEGNNYYQLYEALCAEMKDDGIGVTSASHNSRAVRHGFP